MKELPAKDVSALALLAAAPSPQDMAKLRQGLSEYGERIAKALIDGESGDAEAKQDADAVRRWAAADGG